MFEFISQIMNYSTVLTIVFPVCLDIYSMYTVWTTL